MSAHNKQRDAKHAEEIQGKFKEKSSTVCDILGQVGGERHPVQGKNMKIIHICLLHIHLS